MFRAWVVKSSECRFQDSGPGFWGFIMGFQGSGCVSYVCSGFGVWGFGHRQGPIKDISISNLQGCPYALGCITSRYIHIYGISVS